MLNVTERRVELLKLEGLGYEKSEIVKQLTQQFQCSPRNVYYDFQTRKSWQPHLQDYEQLLAVIINRYEQIYRKASFKNLHSQNESVQLGALKLMLIATDRLRDVLTIRKLKDDIEELERA